MAGSKFKCVVFLITQIGERALPRAPRADRRAVHTVKERDGAWTPSFAEREHWRRERTGIPAGARAGSLQEHVIGPRIERRLLPLMHGLSCRATLPTAAG